MPDQPIEGALFSRNYVRPDHKLSDSPRARRRVHQIDRTFSEDAKGEFVALAQSELGVDFPERFGGYDLERYWKSAAIEDFLSSITLLYMVSRSRGNTLEILRRIFAEEHLRYRIDDQGGVHYLVDEQFEQNVAATLDGLGPARFEAARHALEQAIEGMSGNNPSGKSLIRGVFEAVESGFLASIQPANANRLNDQSINNLLRPILVARYAGTPEADDKIDRVLELLRAWVRTAHPFRHGVPFDQIHEAPLDYAVLLADQGMAFLRHIVAP